MVKKLGEKLAKNFSKLASRVLPGELLDTSQGC
jgi:hypothetical protein